MKEKLFNIARFSMFAVALVQLALSQIHIAIITKIFATEIGFFLFLFIIFGVVVAFNSMNLKSGKNMLIDVVGVVIASLAGIKYLSLVLQDLAVPNLLTFDEARVSIYFSILTIAIYMIGLLVLFLTKGKADEEVN